MTRAVRLVAVALFAVPAVCAALPAGQAPSLAELLDRYMRRDPAVLPALSAVPDLARARAELDRLAPKFLSGDAVDARRRWLAAFALELAQAHAEKQSVAAGQLVEWACRYVRRHDPPDEFDRRWQLAATALLEGGINPAALDAHLRHIAEQHPDEPRFAFAHALAAEQRTAPREILARGHGAAAPEPDRPSSKTPTREWFLEEAARRYQELGLAVPGVRGEAALRRAHVHLALGRYDDALTAIDEVEQHTTDPALVYLGRLFRGLALEGLGRIDESRLAYVSALRSSPGAHSAMMALASSLFRGGRRAEADELSERIVQHSDPRADPWWSYWAGDYRFWYTRLRDVQEMLK